MFHKNIYCIVTLQHHHICYHTYVITLYLYLLIAHIVNKL